MLFPREFEKCLSWSIAFHKAVSTDTCMTMVSSATDNLSDMMAVTTTAIKCGYFIQTIVIIN